MMKKLWEKIKRKLRIWITEEWELTVYFNGDTTITPEGNMLTCKIPATYRVRKIRKLSPKHISFIDMDKHLVEIKVVEPVGYTIKKVW